MGLPVKALARRIASSVDSVPEPVKRRCSAQGTIRWILLAPLHFQLMARAEVGAFGKLLVHGFDHLRVIVAQQYAPCPPM